MANEGNFKRNKKDEIEFLKIQQDIKENFKSQVDSIQSYAEWQAKIGKIWKELKTMQAEILELEKEGTKESLKKAKVLRKEYDQLLEVNKELRKQGSLLKASANILDKQFLGVVGNILTKWFDFDEAVRKTANTMGISGQRMSVMQTNIINAGMKTAAWGVSATALAEAQGSYSDELGRSVILSEQALENMAILGTKTGLGVDGISQMAAQMEAFGLGATKSVELVTQLSSDAESIGVNSAKVLKSFQSNLGLMNKLNFKNGVKGMMAMSKYSEKYKLDMNSVAAVADKVFRPEGAIEAAAQLQVLGGSLSSLGDPFQLMYKARNSPEELAKSLTKAATASATFDKTTGEWKVNAYELDRLKEAGAALGISYEELVKTAKQGAKINMFEGLLKGKGLDQEQIDMLSGLADADGTIQVGFNKDGTANIKKLSELTKGDAEVLMEKRKLADKSQKDAVSMRQQWQGVLDQLMMATWPLLQALQEYLKPGVDVLTTKITEFMGSIKTWTKGIGIFLGAVTLLWAGMQVFKAIDIVKGFFGTGKHFKAGLEMAKGFQAGTTGKGGLSTNTKDFLKSQSGGFKRNAGGGLTRVTQGPAIDNGPGQMTKGLNPMDMIKGAAAILILSAALFVFAKALQEFDKLQNGWETLAQAAVGLTVLGVAAWLIGKASGSMIEGAIAITLLGASLIPFAYGMSLMQGLSWESLAIAGVALVVFTAAIFGLGLLMATGIGAVLFGAGIIAMIALGGALLVLGLGLSAVTAPLIQFSTAIGGDGSGLISAGTGFMVMAMGVEKLGQAMFGLTTTAIVGLPIIMMLTKMGSTLASSVGAINSVDTDKLNSLKELAQWLSLLGGTTTIKFDESLTVDGEIELTGKNGSSTEIDLSKLNSAQKEELAKMIFSTHEYSKRGMAS